MDNIELSSAINELRADDVAEFVSTMRKLGELLKGGVDGDRGILLRDELLGARIYEAAVIHSESQSIQGWNRIEKMLSSWDGRDVEVINVDAGFAYYGTLVEDSADADEGYKRYKLLQQGEAGLRDFTFQDVQEAAVNPDGKRFIILG